ncbi:FG-GAP-like repeat-containing protein [Dyadobacter chenhuakuii]|uniref:FG-GAP-like repeat-containing protein n=1 Tax=Dyadobacter chenhuakuii TaxID=2909339 RepID=A0ABY4XPS7_9BACT|nr:FG-GAP-like repeat-containing protein [Dyadobacter chenhuakuii]MCF2494590.1 FG-GAP-like repeat-containing protein [Dyadobacter chenhuakuii]USJ32088.1 FG-GAP-like repeat-containing protein [Dyadobacter chenhuakuii]
MKQHYKKGLYFVLFSMLVIAYILNTQRLTLSKSVSYITKMVRLNEYQQQSSVVHDSTVSNIQQSLAKREYNISFDDEKKSLQSPNRKQGLRAYYKPGELTVNNRVDSAGHNFSFKLINEGIYADGQKILGPQTDAALHHADNKLQIRHRGFTEEFINNEEGVRQNFIISSAPKATRELQVRLSAKGLKVKDLQNNQLQFYAENKRGELVRSLIYKDIKCWDAKGDTLPATLSYKNGLVMLSVAVEDATYPVTIDPIVINGNPANASAAFESNQTSAWMGYAVSSAGDINSDGYSDLLVGAPMFDKGHTNEGVVFVYHGSASGPILNPVLILEGNQNEAQYGYAVSTAGDVNKDGYSDIIIGARFYDKGQTNEGAAFVYHGSANGIVVNATVLQSNQADANFGKSVSLAGDVNADGYSDLLVGAPLFESGGQADEGAAFIFHGSASGINPIAAITLEGNQASGQFGHATAGAGDINGDGYSDIVIGAYAYDKGQTNEGVAFIYHGSALGISNNANTILEGNQANAQFGISVSGAGDINGDGYSDLVVGASAYDKNFGDEGAAFIYKGSANGVITAPASIIYSNQGAAQLGAAVANAGDVNGDGFSDLLLTASRYDKGQTNEGVVFLHLGSPTGIQNTPTSTFEGDQAEAFLGSATGVASAGDVNGDGYSDIVIGAYSFDKGQVDEGAAFVWMGMASGVPNVAALELKAIQKDALFGSSVASAGDLNGDGFDDIVIGASAYDNGQDREGVAFIYYGSPSGPNPVPVMLEVNKEGACFGGSVSSAGDVNGDGFDDVIIGADFYDKVQEDVGAFFVFHGSSKGISNVPNFQYFGLQEEEWLGYSVSGAGDINGDGFADVVIGAFGADVGDFDHGYEGRFLVFYGSQNGIIQIPTRIDGVDNGMHFGSSLSSAGDINGDGFSDIVVGNPHYYDGEENEGAVYVYTGSITGLNPTPSILQGNVALAEIGTSVSSAGDVNGDGYGDIIAGARYFTNGQTNEGAAFLYYGSISGIANKQPVILESNKINGYMGYDVGAAGDINGDGYGDIIVGAPADETSNGNVFIYYGSSSGILPGSTQNCNLKDPSGMLGSYFGLRTAGAGDINGDGYADVLIGALDWNNGQNTEASVFQYNGNSNKNLQNNLRLYNSDLTTPINQSQKAKNNFGISLYAKSFLGRSKGKLVWETKAKGQGFSKGANNVITNSTMSSGSWIGYASLGLTGVEMKSVIGKQGTSTKVRVRVKYDPALALTGQLYGPWRYLPAYLLGNSAAPVPENVVDDMSETVRRKVGETMAEKEGELVNVYPNPASDRLMLKSDDFDKIKSTQMLTVTGRSVYRSLAPVTEIDVRNFAAGNYILLITHADGSVSTRKVVIEK